MVVAVTEFFDLDRAELTLLLEAKISRWKYKDKRLFVARHKTYADFDTITVLWADNEEEARQRLDNGEWVKGEYTLREEQL